MRRLTHAARRPAGWLLGLLLLAGCSDQLPTEPMNSTLPVPRAPNLSTASDLQATPPGYIRIGVVPSAEAVRVGATSDFVVKNKATGETLLTGSSEQVEVKLVGNFTSKTSKRLQVACIGEAARDDLIQRAQAKGYVTYTTFIETSWGGCWRVYLGDFPMDASWSVREAFRQQAIADGLAGTDSFWPWSGVIIVEGSTQYQITRGSEVVTSDDLVTVEPGSGRVLISGKPYRGIAEVAVNSSGTLAGINELPLEEYLYGVVPRELPPTYYDELEAQKAQAVAARTYAISGLGKRRADGYDLLPTTSDQVYGGYAAEHSLSNRAVDETAWIVATYEGRLISAVFSSTSGGHTANNEEVWGSSPVPYLRGVPDAERGKAFENVPTVEVFKNAANAVSLRAFKPSDNESDWSRYYRWNFEWTAEEIARVIAAATGANVTRVEAINVLDRGPSGRVLRIEYVTDAGTFYETKDRIRWSLKFVDSRGNLRSLLSTLFFIEPVVENKTKEVVGFKTYGGGWGHGVGLSQTGATGMAEKGSTYEAILKHYYQGIELEERSY
jgi:stage II sporulation protein D